MPHSSQVLSQAQIDQFITDGFVRLDDAFPRDLADKCRAFLWGQTGCDPDDPSTWTQPVIRLNHFGGPLFSGAANTPRLHGAFDQLVGPDRWVPQGTLGTFPVRFPLPEEPGDDGWHVDVSFGTDNPDFMAWRANVSSRGRALLMLFLFSDVGEDDAPTRISVGSHQNVAKLLEPAGDAGLTLRQLVEAGFGGGLDHELAVATGDAGTVYLCHPFLVHAAQPHRGSRVKFMAQPPLLPAEPLSLHRPDGTYSPVETAIRQALGRT